MSLNISFVALRVFPAVLLGGLESRRRFQAGLLSALEQFGTFLVELHLPVFVNPDPTGDSVIRGCLDMLGGVAIVRPDGLFGEKRIERI